MSQVSTTGDPSARKDGQAKMSVSLAKKFGLLPEAGRLYKEPHFRGMLRLLDEGGKEAGKGTGKKQIFAYVSLCVFP